MLIIAHIKQNYLNDRSNSGRVDGFWGIIFNFTTSARIESMSGNKILKITQQHSCADLSVTWILTALWTSHCLEQRNRITVHFWIIIWIWHATAYLFLNLTESRYTLVKFDSQVNFILEMDKIETNWNCRFLMNLENISIFCSF